MVLASLVGNISYLLWYFEKQINRYMKVKKQYRDLEKNYKELYKNHFKNIC